jgi:NAD-dependent dihydropyrimidine dehydrogenase PreA subunit
LCIEACPPKAIALNDRLNHYGYRTAAYAGAGCTACGICFLVCPEPGAITVLRRRNGVATLSLVGNGAKNGAQSAVFGHCVEWGTGCATN